MKVFVRVAIFIAWHWPCCIDRLWEALVECLLPSSLVLSLDHILELCKGVDPGEFAFLCPLVELGDCLIDGELDGVTSIILMDFDEVFCPWDCCYETCRLSTRCRCCPISSLPCRKEDSRKWMPLRLSSRFVRPSIYLLMLCTFFMTLNVFLVTLHVLFVTLHIRFVGIYHVPHNIAVVTVRYHTEVDKLKLKLD